MLSGLCSKLMLIRSSPADKAKGKSKCCEAPQTQNTDIEMKNLHPQPEPKHGPRGKDKANVQLGNGPPSWYANQHGLKHLKGSSGPRWVGIFQR
jgi:hypothetical protein